MRKTDKDKDDALRAVRIKFDTDKRASACAAVAAQDAAVEAAVKAGKKRAERLESAFDFSTSATWTIC